MTAEIEAIFISSDAPGDAARSLADLLDLTEEAAGDGQHVLLGSSTHLVVEPPSNDNPPGSVVLWMRVPDARATYDRFLRTGAHSLAAPLSGGGEVVASVRTRHGLDLGLISVDAVSSPETVDGTDPAPD